MKKIVIVTFLFTAALSTKAQTPCAGGLFPSIDSLRSFINVHVRNSAINAFTNLRLNTAMVGVTQWLDCIRDNGMDSISIIDAAGSNPDTIKVYKKGAFAFYKLLPAGGGGENVTVSNATVSGYKLVKQVSTKDYVVKSILPGVAVRLDSNATGVTVNTDTANLPKTVWREGSNITLNWTAPAVAGQPDTVTISSANTGTITSFSFSNVNGFAGTVTNASTTPSLSLTLQDATGSQAGKLTATDWNTFNNKLSNITGLVTAGSNVTVTGSGTSGNPYVVSSTGGGGSSSADTRFYGIVHNKKTWSNLTDYTQSGSTFSIVSNKIRATNGSAGFTNTVSYNYYTLLEQWTASARIIVPASPNSGPWIGMQSVNSAASNVIGALYLSGANAGKVALYLGVGNTLASMSTTALTINTGDSIVLTTKYERNAVSVTAINTTTGAAPVTTYFNYSLLATPSMPNTGRFALGNMGGTGTFDVDSISITSPVMKGADLYVLGNSKTQGYNASLYINTFVEKLREYMNVVNGGGGADQTSHMLLRVPEIIALQPKKVLLVDVSSNDVRASVSSSTIHSNLQTIIDNLHAAGISVIIGTPIYETSINLQSEYAYITSTYPADSVLDLYTATKNANLLYVDGIHPDDDGNELLSQLIVNSGKLTVNQKQTTFVGEGAANQIPVYDQQRRAIGNSNLTFVNNLFKIGSAFQAGNNFSYTGAAISAGTVSNFPTLAWYNAAGGTNEKIWDIFAFSNTLYGRAVNDPVTGASDWLNVRRSGANITFVAFPNGKTFIGANSDNGSSAIFQAAGKGFFSNSIFGQFAAGDFAYSSGFGASATGAGEYYLRAPSAATDEKLWDTYVDATGLYDRAINDANTGAAIWRKVTRVGTAINTVEYPSGRLLFGAPTDDGTTRLQVNGSGLFNDVAFIGSISSTNKKFGAGENAIGWPYMYWKNTGAGTDSKLWDWYFDGSGNSVLRVINDANSGANDVWTINRTGIAVNYFQLHTPLRYNSAPTLSTDLYVPSLGQVKDNAFTLTNKTLTAPIINVGSDATGDIYYRNSGGAFTRLPIGTSSQVLTVSSGLPSWQNASAPTTADYTPTLTSVTNVTSSTAIQGSYDRLGDYVTYYFTVEITTTGAGATELGVSLPIASDFLVSTSLHGSFSSDGSISARASADPTNDRASFKFDSPSSGSYTFSGSFRYKVVAP